MVAEPDSSAEVADKGDGDTCGNVGNVGCGSEEDVGVDCTLGAEDGLIIKFVGDEADDVACDPFAGPGSTGSRAAMDWAGVRWVLPPKGMVRLPAPMVLSNRSTSPRREA